MTGMLRRRKTAATRPGNVPEAVPFGTGRDFERGVEFGLMFARLKDYGRVEMTVHADMAEMVIRAAERRGEPFSGAPHEHDAECRDFHDPGDYLDIVIGQL